MFHKNIMMAQVEKAVADVLQEYNDGTGRKGCSRCITVPYTPFYQNKEMFSLEI
jgi:hypothetical protein